MEEGMIWEATAIVKDNDMMVSKIGYYTKQSDAESFVNSLRIRYGNLFGSAIIRVRSAKRKINV
jgi:hypothetical protein